MSKYFFVMSAVISVMSFWGLFLIMMPNHATVVYDCRLAEISPDFPTEVRNACRKKNSGRI
jgi:hypothetical protein